MASQLFATKSIDELHAQEASGQRAAPRAHRHAADAARHRRHHRHRHLRAHRHRRRQPRRPGPRAVLHHRRHRLHVRRPVLRRVRRDDPGLRQRLLLLLRDARRGHRLVHRLEPDPRVPVRGRHRLGRLVGLRGQSARSAWHITCRPRSRTRRSPMDEGTAPGAHRRHHQPAGDADRVCASRPSATSASSSRPSSTRSSSSSRSP